MARLQKILEDIRRRPEHERRILAFTVYCALAATVLAIGVESFRTSLNLPGGALAESAPDQQEVTAEEPAAERNSPLSPLQSLVATIRDATGELKNFREELGRTAADIASSTTEEIFETEEEGGPLTAANTAPALEAEPAQVESLQTNSGVASSLGGLRQPDGGSPIPAVEPPIPAPPKREEKSKSALARVLRHNFEEIGRTFRDLYQYVRDE